MSRKKTKARRPLTISIHGEDIDIEAKLSYSRLSDVLAETIKRVTDAKTSAGPTTKSTGSPLATLIGEFGKMLRRDQLEMLMNTLDMEQKLIFMEIMNQAQSEHVDN
jgi:hypothetical protein